MMKNKNLVLGILILIILGVLFVSGCIQGDGPGNGADGQNGDGAIMPADLTQITFFEGEGMTADPDWSPDGTQIVFGKEGELYIINSDGTGLTKIGSSGYDNIYNPSWSPVDNKISCTGWDEGENSALYMIDLDSLLQNSNLSIKI